MAHNTDAQQHHSLNIAVKRKCDFYIVEQQVLNDLED